MKASMKVHIPKSLIFEILEKSKRTHLEICGILVGTEDDLNFMVKEVHFTENTLSSSIRFQIDAKEFIRIYEDSVERGLDVVGFFHSHPSSPYPSSVDEMYMSLWPNKVWLIVSSTELSYKAFIVADNRITEIEIVEN
jgi:proteasome lid subunit RPN8/RPN11